MTINPYMDISAYRAGVRIKLCNTIGMVIGSSINRSIVIAYGGQITKIRKVNMHCPPTVRTRA